MSALLEEKGGSPDERVKGFETKFSDELKHYGWRIWEQYGNDAGWHWEAFAAEIDDRPGGHREGTGTSWENCDNQVYLAVLELLGAKSN
jgi:hypothetical protein